MVPIFHQPEVYHECKLNLKSWPFWHVEENVVFVTIDTGANI